MDRGVKCARENLSVFTARGLERMVGNYWSFFVLYFGFCFSLFMEPWGTLIFSLFFCNGGLVAIEESKSLQCKIILLTREIRKKDFWNSKGTGRFVCPSVHRFLPFLGTLTRDMQLQEAYDSVRSQRLKTELVTKYERNSREKRGRIKRCPKPICKVPDSSLSWVSVEFISASKMKSLEAELRCLCSVLDLCRHVWGYIEQHWVEFNELTLNHSIMYSLWHFLWVC